MVAGKNAERALIGRCITALAARARAAGFQTTEYILNLAASELWKDIEKENQKGPKE
jgi:hypothetical protein